MLTLVPIWAVMGLSWNLLSGYTGLVSFGHASFFGLGAYTVTIALVDFDVTPWLGIPLGMLVGVAAAALIGYPTFRLRGHYFALAMLAYPLALLYVFEWLGYQEVALPMKREAPAWYMQFSDPRAYTAIAVALLVLALLVSLAVTPLRRITGMNWLTRFRRMLGLFAFFYGSLHLMTYVAFDRFFHLSRPFL
jgi:branched-chain amino acid transport system permease protein